MSEELKACPFCGSTKVCTVININATPAGVQAVCGSCGASSYHYATKYEAIKAWNFRRNAKNSSRFYQNTDCEYFPCHKVADNENFSCLFCYCPLYRMEKCPGNPENLPNGIKDCTNCILPHVDYDAVIERLKEEQE